VAKLKVPTDGSSDGCVAVPRALSLGLREHPGRYYDNFHNKPYLEGASSTGRVAISLDPQRQGQGSLLALIHPTSS
jgi:hypothetical protein